MEPKEANEITGVLMEKKCWKRKRREEKKDQGKSNVGRLKYFKII
jgi:hypothetical protein